MVFWLLGRRQRDPLPPVLEPEAPGRAVGRYVRRILDESRAYLNEGLDSFGVLEDNRSGGYSIRVRPVQGTKVTGGGRRAAGGGRRAAGGGRRAAGGGRRAAGGGGAGRAWQGVRCQRLKAGKAPS
jgi:hypothetical protein